MKRASLFLAMLMSPAVSVAAQCMAEPTLEARGWSSLASPPGDGAALIGFQKGLQIHYQRAIEFAPDSKEALIAQSRLARQ